MMGQSTQTNNIIERPKQKADQRELLYSLQKKLKKEQDKEQDYTILKILKENEN